MPFPNVNQDNWKASMYKAVVQLLINDDYVTEYESITQAVNQGGFRFKSVSNCCHGKQRTHKHYKFMFKGDYEKYVREKQSDNSV